MRFLGRLIKWTFIFALLLIIVLASPIGYV